MNDSDLNSLISHVLQLPCRDGFDRLGATEKLLLIGVAVQTRGQVVEISQDGFKQFSEWLGLGTATVRKACKVLAAVGLLSATPTRGGRGRASTAYKFDAAVVTQMLTDAAPIHGGGQIGAALLRAFFDSAHQELFASPPFIGSVQAGGVKKLGATKPVVVLLFALLWSLADEYGAVWWVGLGDLAERIGVKAKQVTRVLKSLEQAGYVIARVQGITDATFFGRQSGAFLLRRQAKIVMSVAGQLPTKLGVTVLRQEDASVLLLKQLRVNSMVEADLQAIYNKLKSIEAQLVEGGSNQREWGQVKSKVKSEMLLQVEQILARKVSLTDRIRLAESGLKLMADKGVITMDAAADIRDELMRFAKAPRLLPRGAASSKGHELWYQAYILRYVPIYLRSEGAEEGPRIKTLQRLISDLNESTPTPAFIAKEAWIWLHAVVFMEAIQQISSLILKIVEIEQKREDKGGRYRGSLIETVFPKKHNWATALIIMSSQV